MRLIAATCRCLSRLSALAFALVLLLPLGGRAGEVAIGNGGSYPLSREFSFLEDRGGKLSLEELLQPAVQERFTALPVAGAGANFGFTRSAIWLRVTLRTTADAPRAWLLEVAYAPLDHLELYAPGVTGYERQLAGDNLLFASRVIPHRNHVLPVTLAPGTTQTLYLRVQSEGAVTAPVNLWQPAALWQHDQAAYSALSLYFGLLVGLLLYNLLLFVSVRDTVYLVYALFVGGMALFQLALTGVGYQFLWPGQLWWNIHAPPIGTVTAATFGILFARSFLSSASRTPWIDKLLLLEAAGFVGALVVCIGVSYTASTFIITGLVLVTVITLIVAGVLGLRYDHPGARNFLLSWTVLLLGVAVLALHNMGTLPSNAFTANAVLIGSALEMVMLSFALADRMNVARRFKQQAQTRIASEQAMVHALSVSQEQLRTSLEEREVILNNSIVGIAFLTPEGRFRWANPAMLEILGANGRYIDSMERFYPSREQYLQVGLEVADHVRRGMVYEAEMQIRQWDGPLIWISLSGKGVVVDGRVRGSVWVIMNITRRKQLEEQLRSALAAHEAGAAASTPSAV